MARRPSSQGAAGGRGRRSGRHTETHDPASVLDGEVRRLADRPVPLHELRHTCASLLARPWGPCARRDGNARALGHRRHDEHLQPRAAVAATRGCQPHERAARVSGLPSTTAVRSCHAGQEAGEQGPKTLVRGGGPRRARTHNQRIERVPDFNDTPCCLGLRCSFARRSAFNSPRRRQLASQPVSRRRAQRGRVPRGLGARMLLVRRVDLAAEVAERTEPSTLRRRLAAGGGRSGERRRRSRVLERHLCAPREGFRPGAAPMMSARPTSTPS
jgi:hypothetical protein